MAATLDPGRKLSDDLVERIALAVAPRPVTRELLESVMQALEATGMQGPITIVVNTAGTNAVLPEQLEQAVLEDVERKERQARSRQAEQDFRDRLQRQEWRRKGRRRR